MLENSRVGFVQLGRVFPDKFESPVCGAQIPAERHPRLLDTSAKSDVLYGTGNLMLRESRMVGNTRSETKVCGDRRGHNSSPPPPPAFARRTVGCSAIPAVLDK